MRARGSCFAFILFASLLFSSYAEASPGARGKKLERAAERQVGLIVKLTRNLRPGAKISVAQRAALKSKLLRDRKLKESLRAKSVLDVAETAASSADEKVPFLPIQTPIHVAKFELPAPESASFVLHGTLPLPPHALSTGSGFSIQDADGTLVPAQLAVMSRYAAEAQGPDIVEVMARIKRKGSTPGAPIQYNVYTGANINAQFTIPADVFDFLATPNSLLIAAKDVHGNIYWANLMGGGKAEVIKYGHAEAQISNYVVMRPLVPAAPNTLPHLFGVKAYFTLLAGTNALRLDLRIDNGPSNKDKAKSDDDPLGNVYFESLRLYAAKGYKQVPHLTDPALGAFVTSDPNWNTVDIAAPLPGGKMHLMPSRAQIVRSFAIARIEKESEAARLVKQEGIAFVQPGTNGSGTPLYSWWNPLTPRFSAQRHELPKLTAQGKSAVGSELASRFAQQRNLLATGGTSSYPNVLPSMGLFHTLYSSYMGDTGGSGINPHSPGGIKTAYAASNAGYQLAQLEMRMMVSRQKTALYNKDGRPTNLHEWLIPQSGAPNAYYLSTIVSNGQFIGSDPFGYQSAANTHISVVQSQGKQPSYESALLGVDPIDSQHLVRYTDPLKTLFFLGNDPAAKDLLRAVAEITRLWYHPFANDPWGTCQNTGMCEDLEFVAQYPGKGFTFGRAEAWGVDAMTIAYAMGDDAWRAQARSWFDQLVGLLKAGQVACNGAIQAENFNDKNLPLPSSYRISQLFEVSLVVHALEGLVESVYGGTGTVEETEIKNVAKKALGFIIAPTTWHTFNHGPAYKIAISPADPALSPFCSSIPADGKSNEIENIQSWSSLAFGYERTGNIGFLERAIEMAGGTPDALIAKMQASDDNIQNKAAMLALLQGIGVP